MNSLKRTLAITATSAALQMLGALSLLLLAAWCAHAQTPPPQQITFGTPPPQPVATVTARGTAGGTANYCYWIVAKYPAGNASPSLTPSCVSGVGTSVSVIWSAMAGATTYDVLRTVAPVLPTIFPASIAVATSVAGTSTTDSLAAANPYTISSAPAAATSIVLDNSLQAHPTLKYGVNGAVGERLLGIDEAVTPANPVSGSTLLYPKGGKWCSLDPAGNENCTGGGGGGVPGAPFLSFQFNSAGAFAGSAPLTYNPTNQAIQYGASSATAGIGGQFASFNQSWRAGADFGTLAGGSQISLIEPGCNPGGGNIQTAECVHNYLSGLYNPADNGNLFGKGSYRTYLFNGRNAYDALHGYDKKTIIGLDSSETYLPAAGQASGSYIGMLRTGAGDGLALNIQNSYESFISAAGDEGGEGMSLMLQSQTGLLQTAILASSVTTCAATSITQPGGIIKSTSPIDIKTFSVNSTANCLIGDHLTLDQGTSGRVEVVVVTAVGAGTLSALLQSDHAQGSPVAPARVLTVADNRLIYSGAWGQGREVVDLTTQTTAGNADVSGSLSGGSSAAVVGHGTAWSGITYRACIAFAADNQTHWPWSVGLPLVSWYPILSIDSDTTLTLERGYGGHSYSGTGYVISPCAKVGMLDVDYSVPGEESILHVVLESNGHAWNVGHAVEQAVTAYGSFAHGILIKYAAYSEQIGNKPGLLSMLNMGFSPAIAGIYMPPNTMFGLDSATSASYQSLISLGANSSSGQVNLGGKDLSGSAINMTTFNDGGITDVKRIQWNGGLAALSLDFEATRKLVVSSTTNQMRWTDFNDHVAYGPVWDWSAPVSAFHSTRITIPDQSGTLNLMGPGEMTRTLPGVVGQAVDVGHFLQGSFSLHGSLQIYVCRQVGVSCKIYLLAQNLPYADNLWQIVAPLSSVLGGNDFDLDILASNADGNLYLRLRQTANAGGSQGLVVGIYAGGVGLNGNDFVESTAVTTPAVPTQYLSSTALTQQDGIAYAYGAFAGAGTAPAVDATSCTGATIGTGATNTAGTITGLPVGACTVVVTFAGVTAPHGWSCAVADQTTGNLFRQTASSGTTVTFAGTSVAADVLTYGPCTGF